MGKRAEKQSETDAIELYDEARRVVGRHEYVESYAPCRNLYNFEYRCNCGHEEYVIKIMDAIHAGSNDSK